MSDILIKNMEMPESCFYCPFRRKIDPDNIQCLVTRDVFEETFSGTIEMRNKGNCPLTEVPPHGRLIDADAYRKEIRDRYESAREWYKGAKTDDIKARAESALFTFTECSLTLRKMPTIIEAEGET